MKLHKTKLRIPPHQIQQSSNIQKRNMNKPKYLNDYVLEDDSVNVTVHYCYRVYDVPNTYNEAIPSSESRYWKRAMSEEMNSVLNNDTFEICRLPEGRKVIGGRWVYAVKLGPNGDEQYKARYVAKGYSQVQDIDYVGFRPCFLPPVS